MKLFCQIKVMKYTKVFFYAVSMQLKDIVNACTFISLSMDESADMWDGAQ